MDPVSERLAQVAQPIIPAAVASRGTTRVKQVSASTNRGPGVDEGTLPALHYAAELEDEEMLTLLLGAGADPASVIDTYAIDRL